SSNLTPKTEARAATPDPASIHALDEEVLRKPGSELMIRRMSDPVPLEPGVRDRHRIIEYNSEHRAVVQSFRTLRTLLLQQASASNFVTLVTGLREGSGASFVARNLAASLA